MRLTNIAIIVVGFLLFLTSCSQKNTVQLIEKKEMSRVDELVSKMTLAEKVGQMNQYNGFWDATGPAPAAGNAKKKYEDLRSGKVGSVLNVVGVENVRKMQEEVVNESRLGIPLIFGYDVIHGHKTLSPIPLAEAASWDLEAIQKSARTAAIEATARGLNWTFAPMVDISRDARWGRVMEGAGEDPYLGSQIGMARVKGFQGSDLSSSNTMAATLKHFAGYGFSEAGRDYNAVDVGTSTLYNVILPPFKAGVEIGAATVMNSFNTLNGVPATGDAFLMRDILKGAWGFEGFVISDWSSGREMIAHGFSKDIEHVAVQSANAGSDMDMESSAYVDHLEKAVTDGKVDIKVIDDAVTRILQVKEDLGLLDDPYKYCDEAREKDLLYHEDHKAAALDMAKKSIVLLRNENKMLPIKDANKLAVIGPLADDKTSPLGSWRIGSDDGTAVSVLEGLDAAGISYEYSSGPKLITAPVDFINEVKINEDDRTGIEEAVTLAKKSETVIMVLGEHGYQSGEGRSRTKLDFPGLQQELLEAVHAVNPNIILVVMSGRPLVLSWADENLPAIVQAWQLGTQAGHAIAEVLTGKYNPSGKLPMSFPRSVGQMPLYYNAMNTGRPGPLELVFWTHYIDEENSALYPFGYGKSYTEFSYDKPVITNNYSTTGKVNVSVNLKNVGDVKGKEVVQLYIRDKVGKVVRPVKELKGFELVELAKGESKVVKFTLDESHLGFYDNQGKYLVEEGDFDIFVGGSSDCPLGASITLKKKVMISQP
jgi:beta-glucosidase